jgi:hypothetical protein
MTHFKTAWAFASGVFASRKKAKSGERGANVAIFLKSRCVEWARERVEARWGLREKDN